MKGTEFYNQLEYVEKLDVEKMQAGLRFLRYCAGLYAEEVVHYLGITRQYYTQLETGKRKLTKSMAIAILYVFGHNRVWQRVNDYDTNYCTVFMWITQKDCVLDIDDNCKLSEFIANNRRHKVDYFEDLRDGLAKALSDSKIVKHEGYDFIVDKLAINMCNLLNRFEEKKQNE